MIEPVKTGTVTLPWQIYNEGSEDNPAYNVYIGGDDPFDEWFETPEDAERAISRWNQ